MISWFAGIPFERKYTWKAAHAVPVASNPRIRLFRRRSTAARAVLRVGMEEIPDGISSTPPSGETFPDAAP
jgi:hypothetical protein